MVVERVVVVDKVIDFLCRVVVFVVVNLVLREFVVVVVYLLYKRVDLLHGGDVLVL